MRGKKSKTAKAIVLLLSITMVVWMLSACSSSKTNSDLSMAGDVDNFYESVDTEYAYDIAETLAYDDKYLSNDMGFRNAGSDAEHAAADYLVSKMKKLGLTDIEKVPVKVDKWQFNSASIQVKGQDKVVKPASYATNGTSKEGITAELVDVGTGTDAEYSGKDVKGKIVLAGINQSEESWIDGYMEEAYTKGAAAIITYDVGGYATISDNAINMQDVCAPDLMPCVSISKNQGDYFKEQIKKGNKKITLKVDNEVKINGGTSYNVIGKIKGNDSSQRMIYSGHYDVHFNGFQDDSCAIGLVLATAKAMKDSKYKPENDIYFVCHGAEEWGASASQDDWTTGAWEMINTAHPEWVGSTIAMYNFELPALYSGAKYTTISCVPEFGQNVKKFVNDSGLTIDPTGDIYPEGISEKYTPTATMEDGVSYRFAGVPYYVNVPEGSSNYDGKWFQNRYHTKYDNKKTYNEDVMAFNIKTYGALGIYTDQTPALELNMTADYKLMKEAFNEDIAKAAGVDTTAYTDALNKMKTASDSLFDKAKDINKRYEEAKANDASKSELNKIREEGKTLNKQELKAFKFVQDNLIGVRLTADVVAKHQVVQDDIDYMQQVVEALKDNKPGNTKNEDGALDIAWQVNGGLDYAYYLFNKEAVDIQAGVYDGTYEGSKRFFTRDKLTDFVDVSDATISLLKDEGGKSLKDEIATYNNGIKSQQGQLKTVMTKETKAMNKLVKLLQ